MKLKRFLAGLFVVALLALGWWRWQFYDPPNNIVEITPPAEALPQGRFIHSSFQSNAKGEVPYVAYLPPNWSADDTTTTYPLLIYLYGQGGDEYSFSNTVKASQLSRWINHGEIDPLVVICVQGAKILPDKKWHDQTIQWYDSDNETLLTSDDKGELRDYCRTTFRAGLSSDMIALEGQSRGASGTLYYALKHPDKFSSFIANAYVSDYTLDGLKSSARRNKTELQEQPFHLRMEIGTKDYFVHHYGRTGSPRLHAYLDKLEIPHEYDTLPGGGHGYYQFWNYPREGYENNGLFHLQYHQKFWQTAADSIPQS